MDNTNPYLVSPVKFQTILNEEGNNLENTSKTQYPINVPQSESNPQCSQFGKSSISDVRIPIRSLTKKSFPLDKIQMLRIHNKLLNLEEDMLPHGSLFLPLENLLYLSFQPSCQYHTHEDIKMYCATHHQGMCDFCYKERTDECSIGLLKSGVLSIKTSLEYYDILLRKKKSNIQAMKLSFEHLIRQFLNQENKLRSIIEGQFLDLWDVIEQRKKILLDEASSYFSHYFTKIEEKIRECKREIHRIQNFSQEVKKLIVDIDNGNPHQIISKYDQIIEIRYTTSIQFDISQLQYNYPSIAFKLDQNTLKHYIQNAGNVFKKRNSIFTEEIKVLNTFHSYVNPAIYWHEASSNKIYKFDIQTKSWSRLRDIVGNYQIPRRCRFSYLPDQTLIQTGGINYSEKAGATFNKKCYQFQNHSIDRLQDMNYCRYDHTMQYLQNSIFVMGGINGEYGGVISECEKFDLELHKWIYSQTQYCQS